MADFDYAHDFVKQAEGGYQADPRDRGNWSGGRIHAGKLIGTNRGISAPVLRAWLGRDITPEDMKALTEETAEAIYRAQYWNALGLSDTADDQLARLLYDGAVNQGVGMARRAALYALQHLGRSVATSTPSGALGGLLNSLPADAAHELIWQYRRDRYPTDSPFRAGWLKRLDKLKRKEVIL